MGTMAISRNVLMVASILATSGCGFFQTNQKSKIPSPSHLAGENEAVCDAGLNAYKENIKPIIRGNCFLCHAPDSADAKYRGPQFAEVDDVKSYTQLSKMVDFTNIAQSRLVTKGGDLHCSVSYGFPCGVDVQRMTEAVTAWWEQGEKTCRSKFVSKSVQVPADLKDETFAKLSFSIDDIVEGMSGLTFEVEIRKFFTNSTGEVTYQFRKPRLATANETVRIKEVKILLNGIYYSLADAYTSIDATVNSAALGYQPQVLSSRTMLIPAQNPATDQISIGFAVIEKVEKPLQCKAVETFQKTAYRLNDVRKCYRCHGGGPNQIEGTSEAARAVFNMKLPMDKLCDAWLARTDLEYPMQSLLLDYALRQSFAHEPIVTVNEGRITIPEWVKAEK